MADDEQFSLCWNNFNSNLSAGFHESLCRGDLVDVTLAAEGQLVKAHRLVLSVCSPYFRKMFTQMPANQHAFVFLKDVSHSALKDLIQFMYCGEVNVKQEALPAFISTAEALQIKGLTDSDPSPSAQTPSEPSTPTPQIHQIQTSPRLRQRSVAATRSYKIETVDDTSDEGKQQTTQIVIQTTAAPVQPTTLATQPPTQQIQSQTHQIATVSIPTAAATTTTHVVGTHKRPAQRTTLGSVPHIKRSKTSTIDPLEGAETNATTQQITVQTAVVAEAKSQQQQASEPEYIDLPIELPTKSEPDYADETGEVDQSEQDATYVEDESYGDMRYDESYFTENEDAGGSTTSNVNVSNTTTSVAGSGGNNTVVVGTATTSKAIAKQQSTSFSESSHADATDQTNNDAQDCDSSEEGCISLWDHGRVKYRSSLKGSYQLVLDGFPYTRHRVRGGTIYWRCVQFRPLNCKARVRTNPSGDRVSIVHEVHNHTILRERRKKASFTCTYNYRGQLVYNDYMYSAHNKNFATCTVQWRCCNYYKTKCMAVLITKGKQLFTMRGVHNHTAIKQKTLLAKVFDWEVIPIFVTGLFTNAPQAKENLFRTKSERVLLNQKAPFIRKYVRSDSRKEAIAKIKIIETSSMGRAMVHRDLQQGSKVVKSCYDHHLSIINRPRLFGFCVYCLQKPGVNRSQLSRVNTYCPQCPGGCWSCEECFDWRHPPVNFN